MNRIEQMSSSQRTRFPRNLNNNGVTQHASERPSVSSKTVSKIGITIISNKNSHSIDSLGQFESKLITVQNFKHRKVPMFVPLVRVPLTPIKSSRNRVCGGGTSKEALRRAKR